MVEQSGNLQIRLQERLRPDWSMGNESWRWPVSSFIPPCSRAFFIRERVGKTVGAGSKPRELTVRHVQIELAHVESHWSVGIDLRRKDDGQINKRNDCAMDKKRYQEGCRRLPVGRRLVQKRDQW
jgi:hypothetical protein